ncbi:unnamed protein product [Colias eurytheme]|nr:unnamed protein product [Colias eurytheme]
MNSSNIKNDATAPTAAPCRADNGHEYDLAYRAAMQFSGSMNYCTVSCNARVGATHRLRTTACRAADRLVTALAPP